MSKLRGQIVNREYATQVRDFSGLRFGNITPTDIDGLIEYKGKAFIFIEAKYGDSMPPLGQRLAIERLCDVCKAGGKAAIAFVGRHKTHGDIQFHELEVVAVYVDGAWKPPRKPIKMREAINYFLTTVERRNQ